VGYYVNEEKNCDYANKYSQLGHGDSCVLTSWQMLLTQKFSIWQSWHRKVNSII